MTKYQKKTELYLDKGLSITKDIFFEKGIHLLLYEGVYPLGPE